MTSSSETSCSQPTNRRRLHLAALLFTTALCALSASSGGAFAQTAVERNLPPPVESRGGGLILGNENFAGSTDETPLGTNLRGVRLLGPQGKSLPARLRWESSSAISGRCLAKPLHKQCHRSSALRCRAS